MPTLIARLPRFFFLPTLLAIVAPESSAAQAGLGSLPPGTRVRVGAASLGPTAQAARVVTASADTLVVRPDHASFDVTLPRAEITQLDLGVGRHTHRKRYALIGFGVGAVAGWVVGAVNYSDPCKTEPAICSGFIYETRGSDEFGGALTGGLFGALAGTLAGQVWATDWWQPYPLRTHGAAVRVLPAPSGGRSVALVLTIRS